MVTLSHAAWKKHRRVQGQLKRIARISSLLADAGIVKSQRRKRKKRPYLFERQNHRCAYCHKSKKLTIDHVVSLRMGGADSVDNMVGACDKCNSIKGTIDGYTFYAMLHGSSGLAKLLEELFKTQPWIRSRMQEVAKYASTLRL